MMRCLREVNVDNNTVGWYVFLCRESRIVGASHSIYASIRIFTQGVSELLGAYLELVLPFVPVVFGRRLKKFGSISCDALRLPKHSYRAIILKYKLVVRRF
jgi:hypothetical protein